jgi:hypothetical protein
VYWASPCGSMCQVLRALKSSSTGPIFVFLWKATRLRSQKRLMIVIAVLSSPPGLSRISMMMPSKSLKSRAILSRAVVKLRFLTPFQLEDANVTECPRPAIVKYPGLGRCRLAETVGDKRLLGCFEELFDFSIREFLPEFLV